MKSDEPYDISKGFEASLVLALCASPKLFNRLAKEIDPDKLNAREAQLLLTAARSFTAEHKRPPGDKLAVIEQMHALKRNGRVTEDHILACTRYLADAQSMSDENILAGIVPVLQARLRLQALIENTKAAGQSAPLDKVIQLEQRAKRLETTDEIVTDLLLADDLKQDVKRFRSLERLRIGTSAIDGVVGGTARGEGCILASPTNGGKTMGMCQQAAVACAQRKTVAYATTETAPTMIKMRYAAALTGLMIDEIEDWAVRDVMDHDKVIRSCLSRAGKFSVNYFTANTTSVRDITNWVDELEQANGVGVELLIVDMVDHVLGHTSSASLYERGGEVVAELRDWADPTEGGRWLWMASHLQRGMGVGGRAAGNENIANSMQKVQNADVCMILELTPERDVVMKITKNRNGPVCELDPMPNAFHMGCITHCDFLQEWRRMLLQDS